MLLAVDTSTATIGLALYDGSRVISEEVWQSRNHHTVELSPALSAMMKRAGITGKELRVLAVALGPGSFTSLRIGLALVKGMAFALNLPVVGVPTLDFLAAAQPVRDLPLAAVLQAGRGRLGIVWYSSQNESWQAVSDPQIITAEDLSQAIHRPTLVCGELNAAERQLLGRKRKNVLLVSPAQSVRRPAFLAELAWRRWQDGDHQDPITLAPIYLHIADPVPA